jgi:hypothetical protein
MPAAKTTGEKISDQITELQTSLKTCTNDECTRLDKAIEALKAQEEILKAQDTRLTSIEKTWKESFDPFGKKIDTLVESYDASKKNSAKPDIPADSYFTCATCNSPLILGASECPNKECIDPDTKKRTEIEWGETLASVFPDLVTDEDEK